MDLDIESVEEISKAYSNGFLFTRLKPGNMHQVRSSRIVIANFQLTSENRRVLRKWSGLKLVEHKLPILSNYDWKIHKLGKDFYKTKFPDVNFSASKIREIVTTHHNFNLLFEYKSYLTLGYAIVYKHKEFLHYAYPYYELVGDTSGLGMAMMIKAIEFAASRQCKYIYLGGVTRPTDVYKLQFRGFEWFSDGNWSHDISKLKELLSN